MSFLWTLFNDYFTHTTCLSPYDLLWLGFVFGFRFLGFELVWVSTIAWVIDFSFGNANVSPHRADTQTATKVCHKWEREQSARHTWLPNCFFEECAIYIAYIYHKNIFTWASREREKYLITVACPSKYVLQVISAKKKSNKIFRIFFGCYTNKVYTNHAGTAKLPSINSWNKLTISNFPIGFRCPDR